MPLALQTDEGRPPLPSIDESGRSRSRRLGPPRRWLGIGNVQRGADASELLDAASVGEEAEVANAALSGGVSVGNLDWRQWMAFQEFVEARPADDALAISPGQPLLPYPHHLMGEP